MHFKVAAIPWETYFEIEDAGHGQYQGNGGFEFIFLTVLSQALKFTFEIVVPEKRVIGRIDKNGNWTGIIGMLFRNEADISIEYHPMNLRLFNILDYSFPYNVSYVLFAIKRAGEKSRTFAYFQAFQVSVWICSFSAVVICSLILACFLLREKTTEKYPIFKLLKTTIYTMETLLGYKSYNCVSKNAKAKFFSLCYIMPIRVLAYSFIGLVLAFIMTPIKEHQIETFEELVKASRNDEILVTCFKNGGAYPAFLNTKDPPLSDLAKHLKRYPSDAIPSSEIFIEKIRKGYAVVSGALGKSPYELQIADELFISTDYLAITYRVMAFRKKFCCAENFNKVIMKANEAGIYHQIVRQEYFKLKLQHPSVIDDDTTQENSIRRISINDVASAFYFLGGGYVLVIFVIFFENCIYYIRKTKNSPELYKKTTES